ncbi:hypothetical protein PVAP13_9KG422200 [Panicum virgatum]|uniref:CCHC-type domain-containing protein n=1 Tax=Panicum virgatum TaxID=38727 RepID=A0A8T0NSF4_PANVG|nr:hypothetical protein PVAP13_9KG422200 [Panicum virgatum]
MLAVSSSPPLHLPTSLPPSLIPSPAATTSLPPTFTPSPAATSALSPSPVPVAVSATPTSEPTGRNKAQRWSRDTPPTGKSGGHPSPTFKEVLLEGAAPAAAAAAAASAPSAVSSRPSVVKFVVYPEARRSPAVVVEPDAEGWLPTVSRKARLAAGRLARRPPRPVPVDLRGRCFNCLSPGHRAASCRSSTRCFHCRKTGHRSYVC